MAIDYMLFEIKSGNQTKKLAKLLCQTALKRLPASKKNNSALVLALKGNLGAGKTAFAQGFMKGAGIKKKITSPTFVIAKSYKLKAKSYKKIYHIDCYRVKKEKELLDLGLKEILKNPQNIVLIEWPEIIKKYLPKNAIQIEFEHGEKINERIIKLK